MISGRPNENLEYDGPVPDYKPEPAYLLPKPTIFGGGNFEGYHDIDLLKQLLKSIKEESTNTINECNTILDKYNLQTLSTNLQDVQKTDWPEELGDPKDYVSFEQYKAYADVDTRGAKYVRKAYEDTVRGPTGTCALDIRIVAQELYSEADRIEGFLDGYIGKINDSAEYRILEAFQDWAHMALKYTRIFRGILDARNEDAASIPKEEIANITQDQAKSFQTLFKTKINGFNDELIRSLDDLKKEFSFQQEFFDKFLGPALKFRLNHQENVSSVMQSGFFAGQANAAGTLFKGNVEAAVADQMRRNAACEKRLNDLEVRIKARNSYASYIKQLEPVGAPLRKPFVEVQISEEERTQMRTYASANREAAEAKNNFRSSHADLNDLSEDDSHPQYLLRSGGELTGAVTLAEGATIDGIRPATHTHDGSDGTEKIPGASIVTGSLTSGLVDSDESITVPTNLRIVSQEQSPLGNGLINIQVAWDMPDDATDAFQFEVQVVQLPEGTPSECPTGYVGNYPETPCNPSAQPRIYVETGHDISNYSPEYPAVVRDTVPGFINTGFSFPLTDRAFLVGIDSIRKQHFSVSIYAYDSDDTTSLRIVGLDGPELLTDGDTVNMQQEDTCGISVEGGALVGYTDDWGDGYGPAPTLGKLLTSITSSPLLGSVEQSDKVKLVANIIGGGITYHGVTSVNILNSTNWISTHRRSDDRPGSDDMVTGYITGGTFTPTDLTYSTTSAVVIPGFFGIGDIRSVAVDRDKVALLIHEEDNANSSLDPGWYVMVVDVQFSGGVPSFEFGTPILVVAEDDTSGIPNLVKVEDNRFVVVWGEADTGVCE